MTKYISVTNKIDSVFSVEPVASGSGSTISLSLYPVVHTTGQVNLFTVSSPITLTTISQGTSPLVVSAKELPVGNYLLRVKYDATPVEKITLKWSTSSYTCPYHKDFADTLKTFQGCESAGDIGSPIQIGDFPVQKENSFVNDISQAAQGKPFTYPIYTFQMEANSQVGIKIGLVAANPNAVSISALTIEMRVGALSDTPIDLSGNCASFQSLCTFVYTGPTTGTYYLSIRDKTEQIITKFLQFYIL